MKSCKIHLGLTSARLGRVALLLASFVASMAGRAENSSPAYNFLDITSSSHIYGLGGINISTVEDDISLLDQNPALLGSEIQMQASVNYSRWLGNSNFAGVKYGMRINDHSAWAASVQYYGYGTIDGYDEFGRPTGAFSPKDISINGTYSHDISTYWRGGATLKFVTSSYESYSAIALATDLGVNYYNPDRDLSVSLAVVNLGGQVKRFTDSYDRLPVDVRFGMTKSFGSLPIRFSFTLWNLTKWHLPFYQTGDGTPENPGKVKDTFGSNLFRHIVLAADFVPSDNFYVSLGYNYKTRTDMATYHRNFFSGLSIGAGMKLHNFGFGIAYGQPHSGGSTFMLNISTNLYEFFHHNK